MATTSAGILLYRLASELEVLLVHPGGPFWATKDDGAWSIPKGEFDQLAEDPFEAATREFSEELGHPLPASDPIALGEVTQKGGKRVAAWAVAGDLDPGAVESNTFEMEWPPRSGRMQRFPEVDRAQWCSIEVARRALNPAQVAFLDRLVEALA
ncbi:MAG: NUDIX domain-containing protein [Acidimicrobiia bacterium]